MSDQQKIWFIYLTDHHEGPFSVDEVAQKARSGVVNGQSLAWKDGMPEWVAAETIPELQEAMQPPAARPAPADGRSKLINTAPAASLQQQAASPLEAVAAAQAAQQAQHAIPEGRGEVSLAQLLAASQDARPEGNTNPSILTGPPPGSTNPAIATNPSLSAGTKSGAIADSASVLSSMANQVQAQHPLTSGSGVSLTGLGAAPATPEPMPEEDVWTLKVGVQVSGLYSLNKLMELAATSGIPEEAEIWRPGWSDFESIAVVPQLEVARKARSGRASGTKSNMARPGVAVTAMSNAAAVGDEEPTDTGIIAPPPGWRGKLALIIAQARGLSGKLSLSLKKKKAEEAPAEEVTGSTLAPGAAAKGGKKAAPAGAKKAVAAKAGGGAVKRLAAIIGLVLVLVGLGAGAWMFLRSPIPSSLDVSEEDREAMVEVVKADDGRRLFLAQARGSEDDPADPTSPKYYVASNLPEGSVISLQVTGLPGTLVNRLSFEKTFSAPVEKSRIAVFSQVRDNDGKPLWGEFNFKVSAEGAQPLELQGKFIGSRGAGYQNRLKAFKDSVQSEYDAEVAELREYIATLKNLQAEASRLIAEYKAGWAVPTSRAKITADWAVLRNNSHTLIGQLQQKLRDRLGGSTQPRYHQRAFQDVNTTVGQLDQLVRLHSDRLAGAAPAPGAGNPDELDGLVQAGVLALEQWLAQAVARNPFDPPAAQGAAPTGR